MPFKDVLGSLVYGVKGGIGAVLVDAEGESVDVFTHGDTYEIRLAGAHYGIVLNRLGEAMGGSGNGDRLQSLSIRAEKLTYTIVPVQEGLFVVLIQDDTGLPSQAARALQEALPKIVELI